MKKTFLLFIWIFFFSLVLCEGSFVPRTILALYDSKNRAFEDQTEIHQYLELPLNHLGLKILYHDIDKGLPSNFDDPHIRGVLSFFPSGYKHRDPENTIKCFHSFLDEGKKLVILGDLGIRPEEVDPPVSPMNYNSLFRRIGIETTGQWQTINYNNKVAYKNSLLLDFERSSNLRQPAFRMTSTLNEHATSHLRINIGDHENFSSDLVITHPNGGYVADGYAIFEDYNEKKEEMFSQWIINPLAFFRLAFSTDDLPKADTTTEFGRRIYYSHIDGDGWNNISEIENTEATLSSEIIFKRAIEPYPDLPVSVAPIAADLDPDWEGSEKGQAVAKQYLALPQVEVGSHTYSHPFEWQFFINYTPEKEVPFLPYYANKHFSSKWDPYRSVFDHFLSSINKNSLRYEKPRAFAFEPFSIKKEIVDSVAYIQQFLPQGKAVTSIMWSGNVQPFEEAILLADEQGLAHINGGDSRFDNKYPSLSWVSPLARQINGTVQIYSSNSNENTYTNLWTDRFFGHVLLSKTLQNTESPIRYKPHNLYYHFYSGEKSASLQALIKNLDYARNCEIHPIFASDYFYIAQSFFFVEFEVLGPSHWRIHNRGKLNTIRFDHSISKEVDFVHSQGVVGQRHTQGSLYVSLDPTTPHPEIVLKENLNISYREPKSPVPYLIHSRWPIWNLKCQKNTWSFNSKGFGGGEMLWSVPQEGTYQISTKYGEMQKQFSYPVDSQNLLSFTLPPTFDTLSITIILLSKEG